MKMPKQLLAAAAATLCVMSAHAASAQVATSYTFTGVVSGDAANPFNGSFSLLNTAGTYSLTALSASYRTGSFTLANSGISPLTATSLYIGGTINTVGGIGGATDDFRFTFNPVTGGVGSTDSFVTTTQNSLLSSVTLSIAAAAPTVAAAAPEPAAWGMMILGFGVVGFAMRRRGKVAMRVGYAG